ncbi:MAG: hypothetical protein H0V19_09665 [Euzebyales bacterium]|nr:hypothetical protein [Euzebyales bacterium]
MTADQLAELSAALQRLEGRPVGEHPAVLDEVHRALVDRMQQLTGVTDHAAGAAGG